MDDNVFERLRAGLSRAPEPDATPLALSALNGIPPAEQITLATFNFFDNGSSVKGKWMSARRTMNAQLYTITHKITPKASLAAWSGTVQLHDADFWMSYVDHKAG